MLNDIELEKLERLYFEYIRTFVLNDITNLISNINSRLDILNDWKTQFKNTAHAGYQSSDLEYGAKRVFHHYFSALFKFPNSSPIGPDLMYRCHDAFVHIDIKTALITNPSDFKGKVNIASNQSSYSVPNIFTGNIPNYYTINKVVLPSLTYIIQIVHENFKPELKAILLICIPNGQLYSIYGSSIISGGKPKGKSFRYNYAREPRFLKLCGANFDTFRVEILCLNKNLKQKDIVGIQKFQIPIHCWI
ncbi:MAG: hypothetical protein N2517_08900 [Ignavibacteria bacterium]|nr:hypothetical protein [Ignavibacteria bacterium]